MTKKNDKVKVNQHKLIKKRKTESFQVGRFLLISVPCHDGNSHDISACLCGEQCIKASR